MPTSPAKVYPPVPGEGRAASSTQVNVVRGGHRVVHVRRAALLILRPREEGWSAQDLADFCQAELFAHGHVQLDDALSGRFMVRESPVAIDGVAPRRAHRGERNSPVDRHGDPATEGFAVELPTSPFDAPEPGATARAAPLVVAARERALQALRALLSGDDAFVQQALYAGRIARLRSEGDVESRWTPVLREGEPLSAWILALLSCDVLRCREDYEARLTVCATCGQVGFGWAGGSKTDCGEHSARALGW